MSEQPLPLLLRRLQQVHWALDAGGFDHAVGGALALAVHVLESRATVDIDLNVIADPKDPQPLLDCLPPGIARHPRAADELRTSGQTRLWWSDDQGIDTPLDLFLPQHPQFHQLVNDRAEPFLFGDVPIKVISATDLMVFKMLFNRRKDWVDIESLIEAGTADVDEAALWVASFLGDDDPRLEQLRQLSR